MVDKEIMETVRDFLFWAPKSLQMVTAAIKLKFQRLLLGRKATTNLDSVLKNRNISFANKGPYSQSYHFSSSCVQI